MMSQDELMATVVSIALSAWLWAAWTYGVLAPREFLSPRSARLPLLAAPAAAVALLALILVRFAASDVRESPQYLGMYTAMGAAWVALGVRLFPIFGLHAVDDVVQRRNPASGWAASGAIIGLTLCFSGANIGDGPGWWVVVFCAAIATAAWFALWWLVEATSGLTDAATIDRDTASGMRLGALLAAAGLVLGRSVAGNWVSFDATVADFAALAWPVLALAATESILAIAARPTHDSPAKPVPFLGVIPAAAYLGGAGLYVATMGPWS